jgi:hypothetical protein
MANNEWHPNSLDTRPLFSSFIIITSKCQPVYFALLQMIRYRCSRCCSFVNNRLEYLGTQICFLQGLFNWLAAVAVELLLPKERETASATVMNKCLASWLTCLIIWMLAFYNHHLSFYSDYFAMLRRFFGLFFQRYVLDRPIRPLSLLYIPSFFYSLYLTWKAFRSNPQLDDE